MFKSSKIKSGVGSPAYVVLSSQVAKGLDTVGHPTQICRVRMTIEELLDQYSVGSIVLDEQHRERRCGECSGGHQCPPAARGGGAHPGGVGNTVPLPIERRYPPTREVKPDGMIGKTKGGGVSRT